MSSHVTIKTIADRVGVTHGTVSRALKGDPRVKPQTAERIVALATQLGYTPSGLGRGLRTNRTGTLGIVISCITDPFYSEVIRGVHDAVLPAGYSLFVASTDTDSGSPQTIARSLWERRVDGLFMGCLPQIAQPYQRLVQEENLPIVLINRPSDDYPYNVFNDDARAVEACLDYLVAQGHRRIGFLGNLAAGGPDELRYLSYRESLRRWKLDSQDCNIFFADRGQLRSGADATASWLNRNADCRPTVLLCYNDLLAIGAIHALSEAGLDVPAALSVVGFDDIELAGYINPPLTTFAQPKYELGHRAATLMLQLLGGQPIAAKPLPLFGQLVVRQSVRPV